MTFDSNQATIVHNPRPKANLIVKQGSQIGILFPITADSVILGREETCNIIIQDAEASRKHSELTWDEVSGAYYVQDLGSTNGTFVNGIQATAPTPLEPGNSIGIGQTTLVLEFEAGSPTAQADYEAPAEAKVISGSLVDEEQSQELGNKKWIAFGCGCLILLCACGAISMVGLDLIDVLDLGIPGLSDLRVDF